MRILGIITARGGSKSIPGKNIKTLAGKPLIYYTIEAAKKSKYLTRTIVSTDDKKIAEISRELGIEVPFMRPEYLATDTSKSLDVVKHAVMELEKTDQTYDYILILQPTSPLRRTEDIDKAIETASRLKADSLIAIRRVYDSHPLRVRKIDGKGFLLPYCGSEPEGIRRQDLPPAYVRNGAIYLAKRDLVMEKNTIYGDKVYGYEMPEERSIDINSEVDFLLAEVIINKLKEEGYKF